MPKYNQKYDIFFALLSLDILIDDFKTIHNK